MPASRRHHVLISIKHDSHWSLDPVNNWEGLKRVEKNNGPDTAMKMSPSSSLSLNTCITSVLGVWYPLKVYVHALLKL